MIEWTIRQSVNVLPAPTIEARRSPPAMKVGGYCGLYVRTGQAGSLRMTGGDGARKAMLASQ